MNSDNSPVIKLTPSKIYNIINEQCPIEIEQCPIEIEQPLKPQILIPLRRSNNTTSTLDILEKGIYNEKKVFNKLLEDVPDIIKPKMKEMIITRNNIKYRLKGQCDAMNDDFVFEIKTKVTVNIQAYPTENAIYQLELYLRLFEKERGFIIDSKDDDIKTTCRYRDDILFHFILDKLEALYF